MSQRTLPHVSDVPNAVMAWLKERGLTYDTHLYTPEAWRRRGEKYGNGSLFTITTEGTLNHILNYPESKADLLLIDQFQAFLKELGIYYEQGFAWSLHFYQTGEGR